MLFIIIILGVTIISQLAIAMLLITESRRSRRRDQKLFAAITLTILLWTVINVALLLLSVPGSAEYETFFRIANRLGFMLGAASLFQIYYFSFSYPSRKLIKYYQKILLAFSALTIVSGSSRLVAGTVKVENTYLIYEPGVLSSILAVLSMIVVIDIYRGEAKQLHDKLNDKLRRQAKTLVQGLTFTILHAVLFIVILPIFFGQNDALYAIGYGAPFYFVTFVFFGLFKQNLFDIREFVFRAIVYILSAGCIAAIYSIVVFAVGGAVVDISNVTLLQRVVFAFLTVLIATTFSPILRFFDKATSKIFYRNVYDPQVVSDSISNAIVGNIDPKKLQKEVLSIIDKILQPSSSVLLFVDANDNISYGYSTNLKQQIHSEKQREIIKIIKKIDKTILYVDKLDERQHKLKDALSSEGISVISSLVIKGEVIGYILIGAKKSGNIYSNQDITLLNITSNELAVALQNARRFEEIQVFNKTLQDKVTEATRELKVTNRKLVQLDEAKDEFISMASHQLRTPLTSIKGYLSMVVEGDLGPIKPKQEKVLKDAFESSQRMAYLIADFLNVSRIKTGKFMIEKHEVDLPEVVQEEITQLREMADSRDLKLVYEKPGVFPHVKLDENKTRQVMMNMVDNAIYYTPSGGTITIQLYATADEVIFKVIDTGIGVPKAEHHKLFTKFFRAGNARKARPDGTGLGLFMAQKVVVEQGGAVIFESIEGKGSTFGFRFPLKKIKA